MTKIVINRCYGGFSLSEKAVQRYSEIKGEAARTDFLRYIERDNPVLVQVVEELGEDANARFSELAIVEVPSGMRYRICEYDGMEHVETEEDVRTWDIA